MSKLAKKIAAPAVSLRGRRSKPRPRSAAATRSNAMTALRAAADGRVRHCWLAAGSPFHTASHVCTTYADDFLHTDAISRCVHAVAKYLTIRGIIPLKMDAPDAPRSTDKSSLPEMSGGVDLCNSLATFKGSQHAPNDVLVSALQSDLGLQPFHGDGRSICGDCAEADALR
jgi:hypothetical protein